MWVQQRTGGGLGLADTRTVSLNPSDALGRWPWGNRRTVSWPSTRRWPRSPWGRCGGSGRRARTLWPKGSGRGPGRGLRRWRSRPSSCPVIFRGSCYGPEGGGVSGPLGHGGVAGQSARGTGPDACTRGSHRPLREGHSLNPGPVLRTAAGPSDCHAQRQPGGAPGPGTPWPGHLLGGPRRGLRAGYPHCRCGGGAARGGTPGTRGRGDSRSLGPSAWPWPTRSVFGAGVPA